MPIHPDTCIGPVALTVADLNRSLSFYQRVIGLSVRQQAPKTAVLGTDTAVLLHLRENKVARPVSHTTGLFHFALLVPTRVDLALVYHHLAQMGIDLGASDHLVSEALYLSDPDGNGLEIYADQPRASWAYQNDQLQMGTRRLNVTSLLGELGEDTAVWPRFAQLPPGTKMGHIHLRVADMPSAKQFYGHVLGFEQMAEYGPQASFYAAGGYHHHIGMNTWHSLHAPPSPAYATGLDYFTIETPDTAVVRDNLDQAGLTYTETDRGVWFHDPSRNRILLTQGQ